MATAVPDVSVSSTVPQHPRRRLLVGAAALATVLAAGWSGLRVRPRPLRPAGVQAGEITTVPLPEGLPEPVDRFYRRLYGQQVPLVHSAVITGRGTMRIAGVTFPARFRFSHVTGHAYRHYIELTAFGARILAVNEWFADGTARLELPFGVSEGPNVDQAANLALWAEAVWMPSAWVTDARAHWAPVDATTARLSVPFGDGRETLTVSFDERTGLLRRMTSRRYKGETDEARTEWRNDAHVWGELDGHPVPLRTTVTWADEGSPWADLTTEEVVHNADLGRYIHAEGP